MSALHGAKTPTDWLSSYITGSIKVAKAGYLCSKKPTEFDKLQERLACAGYKGQTAELIHNDDSGSFGFVFIDIDTAKSSGTLDPLGRVLTLTTSLKAVGELESRSEGRLGDSAVEHYMQQLMQRATPPPNTLAEPPDSPQARALIRSFGGHVSGSNLSHLMGELAELLRRPEPGNEETWSELRDQHDQSWLRARWDTVAVASTKPSHLKKLVALEIALQSVWNKFEKAASNLPAIEGDEIRGDITGDKLLRQLAEQYLKVTSWGTRLSGWPRFVMEELRKTSRLDENIRDFFKASEEYVRYEALIREKGARIRDREFQLKVTLAALVAALVVLGEITISIADAAEVKGIVAWVVFAMTIPMAFWLTNAIYTDGQTRWKHLLWLILPLTVVLAGLFYFVASTIPGALPLCGPMVGASLGLVISSLRRARRWGGRS